MGSRRFSPLEGRQICLYGQFNHGVAILPPHSNHIEGFQFDTPVLWPKHEPGCLQRSVPHSLGQERQTDFWKGGETAGFCSNQWSIHLCVRVLLNCTLPGYLWQDHFEFDTLASVFHLFSLLITSASWVFYFFVIHILVLFQLRTKALRL